jgi:hypothetical protein
MNNKYLSLRGWQIPKLNMKYKTEIFFWVDFGLLRVAGGRLPRKFISGSVNL